MRTVWVTGALVGAVAAFAAGFVHVVTGSAVGGIKLLPKVSWSLGETFVNADAVGNMPLIAARSQYPMFVAAMEQQMVSRGVEKVTAENIGRVHLGMYEVDALKLLGKPDEDETTYAGDERRLTWRAKLQVMSVTVIVRDGKVVRII